MVLVVLMAIVGGYGAGYLVKGYLDQKAAEVAQLSPPKPWYQTQRKSAGVVVEIPAGPIFADTDPSESGVVLPYEEALPREIYEPPPDPGPVAVPELPGPEGKPAWRRYAAAAPEINGRPRIVLVIDDLGMDRKRTRETVELDGPLTLSYLSYAPDIKKQGAAAKAAGHELLLHLSMQPSNPEVDPGPNALRTDMPADEIRRRLAWSLDRFESFIGVNNHMGSAFTADTAGMRLVMAELRRRGLLYLDSRTTSKTVGGKLARQFGVPFAERNVFLDHVNEVSEVEARLVEVERMAQRNGLAIAIGHPRKATLQALSRWLPKLSDKGFVLVPLSSVVSGG